MTEAFPVGVLRPPGSEGWQRSGRLRRAGHLEELVAIHGREGGGGAGRRWTTARLNQALLLALAGEFQGFCRDLHQECATLVGDWLSTGSVRIAQVISTSLTFGITLNRGNASPSTLGGDFGRFGLELWPSLKAKDSRTEARQATLEFLNEARNAIVHSDDSKLAALPRRVDLVAFRECRRAADSVARSMDSVMSRHLATLFGRPAPW